MARGEAASRRFPSIVMIDARSEYGSPQQVAVSCGIGYSDRQQNKRIVRANGVVRETWCICIVGTACRIQPFLLLSQRGIFRDATSRMRRSDPIKSLKPKVVDRGGAARLWC
ncbi:hypothetical protein RMSM_03013 [Rhodopirellula maiorica SM1]|uniref:Uncharacterized protein n=1 Tax=Rhodopirellula maiorica SM1 TaxID=1265738 RepID=M5RL71_9BACT|nr:hypothetical protein RMSM_03013 [Rhodopirellula maiorica SM1]